jgi:hypothetical protein
VASRLIDNRMEAKQQDGSPYSYVAHSMPPLFARLRGGMLLRATRVIFMFWNSIAAPTITRSNDLIITRKITSKKKRGKSMRGGTASSAGLYTPCWG